MNNPDRTPAPQTHADLAALLFARGKGHTVHPVTHKAHEVDEDTARAFFGLSAKPTDESEG